MGYSSWFVDLICMLVIFSNSSSVSVSPQKVEVALYYETLCPYCSNFMVNYLPEIFNNSLIDIIDLKLIPYGNAKVAPDNTIICQHGQYECLLNTVEACVLHVWPDLKKQYSFIYCVESLVHVHKYIEWESCFAKTGFDSKPIEDCYKSGLGKQLDLQYAKVTNDLQPPHKYVPWVTVNGQPLYDDYENFMTYVCKAYKGDSVPKACKDLPPPIVSDVKDNQIKQVCLAEETISSSKTEAMHIRPSGTSWRRQMMAISA
ncbi:hypothetical protein AQUCO_03000237v1 [Aquilegia coerulea]|uniref:Saposin A-type domain-containing protein n=2 Tax=Aquilegia coerulea TaxID=218851 RepID=A0A2G5D1Z7_AQUCA|nr:hypothetical protein AQUCO_03000237v1 [Aquilegia coerulea]